MQVARAIKLDLAPDSVRVKVTARYSRQGSVIQGDAHTACQSVLTELSIHSAAPAERLAHLVRMAEASCYTMAALRNPVACELRTTVNGEPFVAAQ